MLSLNQYDYFAAKYKRLVNYNNHMNDLKIPEIPVNVRIGRKIVKFRHLMRLTLVELSIKCRIPVEIIETYERGRGDPCNRVFLDPLSRELNVIF